MRSPLCNPLRLNYLYIFVILFNAVETYCQLPGHCVNGACLDRTCVCRDFWAGQACNVPNCPGEPDCSGHGECRINTVSEPSSLAIPYCACYVGWDSMLDCSLYIPFGEFEKRIIYKLLIHLIQYINTHDFLKE